MAKSQVPAEQVLQALGDPSRRAIVQRLAGGPQSVSALARPLGITLTAVAQHLQLLEQCGLAATQKVGRVRTCRLDTAGFDTLERWIAEQRQLWERRLNRLGAILDEPG